MEEIIEDDDSYTLTVGAISDQEIRLLLVQSMFRNRQQFSIDNASIKNQLNAWVEYVKTGE